MLAPKLKHKNIVPGGGAYPLPSERGWTRDDFGHAVSQSLRIIRGSDREPDRGYLPQLIQHHRDVHLALHFMEPRENLYNKNNNKSISKLFNEVKMDKKSNAKHLYIMLCSQGCGSAVIFCGSGFGSSSFY